MSELIHTIGVACGLGSGDCGTKDGPEFVRQRRVISELCHFASILRISSVLEQDQERVLHDLLLRLSREVEKLVVKNTPFCVIGGDHSIAMGTWSGAKKGISESDRLGLIWIDAHCDAHTHETTHTGNIHGMPVAALLGHGEERFSQIRRGIAIHPEDVVLIGVRDYESEERALLESLGVRVYEMSEVKRRGLALVFQESLDLLRRQTDRYGLSIDLDGLDPCYAPGVGTPVEDGITPTDLYGAIRSCYRDPKLLGLEIVEFNPNLDIENRTLHCLIACVESIFSASPRSFSVLEESASVDLEDRLIDEFLLL